jgi:hypothetical protein
MLKLKTSFAALASTALLFAGLAAPAAAQPIVTGGLVNITVTNVLTGDILSNNNVNLGLALNTAANICGVNVNVLARQLRSGDVSCTIGNQEVTIDQVAG